ncbi:helix-turn-helix domain-containing protein [Chondromyces crocatus]|uniref:AraC family transcriptional regulator n=1 Tax=Chondromyces crocatus TaxID=52 RepID=A0A0K1EFA3_CHOCO|nr:AraC family transcriptional regulator [Chondromyces crocatus]AKT39546.1 AraC family transcriptional regulator [Chondromyces crocatus]
MNTFPGEPIIGAPHGVTAVEHRSRTWNGVTVHALTIHVAPGEAWSLLTGEQTSLSIVLDEIGGRVEPRLKREQPLVSRRAAPGHINFSPGGMPLWGYTDGLRHVKEVRLDFDFTALPAVLGEDLDRLKIQTPRIHFHDDRIVHLGALLTAACEAPDEHSALYGDSLTLALLIDLLRLGTPQPEERSRGGLAPWQLRRVTDYLRAHLSDNVRLEELATMTGLSQSQFSRAFKASTGSPPHRWQMNERILQAQQHLVQGSSSLAEIALATGFTEQSHFTRVFSRMVGASPGAYRRARRG